MIQSPQSTLKLKGKLAAYMWWLFFGTLGAHKFYLGRPAMGLLYMFSLGLFGLGCFVDFFTLPSQVKKANERILIGAGIVELVRGAPRVDIGGLNRDDDDAYQHIDFESYRTVPLTARSIVPAQPSFGRRGL